MTIIAPSLLSCDFLNIEKELKRLNDIDNLWIHLDIMDGHFVPNMTFGPPVIKNFHKVSRHKLDAHLMVENPVDYVEWMKNYQIHNLTFHWESVTHHDRIIQLIKESYPSVGVSLNPSTPTHIIPDYILKNIDLVLLMSVNPGFGGQKYIEHIEGKIEELSEKRKILSAHFQIQVDGGVSDKNAKKITNLGADNLVSGSYIFSAEANNYQDRIESLR